MGDMGPFADVFPYALSDKNNCLKRMTEKVA
jgi:hypothetical protein